MNLCISAVDTLHNFTALFDYYQLATQSAAAANAAGGAAVSTLPTNTEARVSEATADSSPGKETKQQINAQLKEEARQEAEPKESDKLMEDSTSLSMIESFALANNLTFNRLHQTAHMLTN